MLACVYIYIGTIYQIEQDSAVCRQVQQTDKPIYDIVAYEDCMCVVTMGGVLSVFRKNRAAGIRTNSAGNDTTSLQHINTVGPPFTLYNRISQVNYY